MLISLPNSVGIIKPSSASAFGVTWTQRLSLPGGPGAWSALGSNGSRLVAVGTSGISGMYSDNGGITWHKTNQYENMFVGYNAIAYGNGKFVAVGDPQTGTAGPSMASTDGITWANEPYNGSAGWTGVAYGNGIFVRCRATGSSTVTETSTTGIAWSAAASTSGSHSWSGMAFGNNTFVMVGSGIPNPIAYSINPAVSWTQVSVPGGSSFYRAVTYDGTNFIAVGNSTSVATSPDGITWTTRTASASRTWFSVAGGGGVVAACSIDGTTRVMTSTDHGITWTQRTDDRSLEAENWTSINYGGGLFCIIGQSPSNPGSESYYVDTAP